MMRQYEHRRVIGRFVAPPAPPALIRPWTPHRTEHVAPEDPGTDPGKSLLRDAVIDPGPSILVAPHALPDARVEEPLHQFRAADTERVPAILIRASAIAIDGNREASDTEFRHGIPFEWTERRLGDDGARIANVMR